VNLNSNIIQRCI